MIRHVRPKLACPACERIVQVEAPSRPIERSFAAPGLLAHILTAKYSDHLPLYRQAQIYAREGVDLERSMKFMMFSCRFACWTPGHCPPLPGARGAPYASRAEPCLTFTVSGAWLAAAFLWRVPSAAEVFAQRPQKTL